MRSPTPRGDGGDRGDRRVTACPECGDGFHWEGGAWHCRGCGYVPPQGAD